MEQFDAHADVACSVIPAAPGGVPDGEAVPVPGLGRPQRGARIQALLPETHPAGGQVAGGV